MATQKSYTDTIFQRVKLFIEGVEVPFTHISITSGVGGLPNANITIPAQAGLMDIARFYSPKVHIFYTDRLGTYDQTKPDDVKKQDKLLFSGIIVQTSYQKSKGYGGGTVSISFACVHRYHLIQEMLIDYSGWLNGDPLDPNPREAPVKADTANSQSSIIEALSGIIKAHSDTAPPDQQEITEDNPDGKTSVMPTRWAHLFTRIQGMPSVLLNFWNQMKRSAFNRSLREGNLYYSEAFVKIYRPLIENGLQFFDRMGGHYPIESMVSDDQARVEPCPETPNCRDKILIPPVNQMFVSSAAQAEVTIANLSTYLQHSGEVASIYSIFTDFFANIEYEIVTLASPAEVPLHKEIDEMDKSLRDFLTIEDGKKTETYPLDTIIKPKLPFYFSPTCNVLFPGMYHGISLMYDEIGIPTRVKLKNLEGPGSDGWKTNFLAPSSIREAIATKVAGRNGTPGYAKDATYSLKSTTGSSYGAIGVYEQGRGIKLESIILPRWLSLLSQSSFGSSADKKDPTLDDVSDAMRIAALKQLSIGWAKRYPGDERTPLNPYNIDDTDIQAHHRLLFSTADYYYSQVFAKSKSGRIDCPFNPYITPGYPMDILDKNPLYPSVHAHCISVTHTITAESCQTNVDFVAAMTYSELANYYIPFVSPMLQVALGLAETPTLVNSEEAARVKANEFYRYTLGTGAATPDSLIDFATMQIKPAKWLEDGSGWTDGSTGSVRGVNGGELNPMLTYEGNLSLTQRPIESRYSIEQRFGIKFIDMDAGNYGQASIKYKPSNLEEDQKFEIGQSQFLEYKTYFGEEIPIAEVNKQKIDGAVGSGEITKTTDNINGFT
jgi:hypothetical protein